MSRRKVDTRPYSKLVVDGVKQTPSRAMLRAVGFDDRDFKKPQVGIASTWSKVTPCNMHIDKLARGGREGRRRGGRQEHHLQHHHRLRRHLDGHAGHEVLAGVARSDRRLDRDRGRRAGLRRRRRDRRLRQEHAGLRDGHGAARTVPRCSSTAARSCPGAEASATSSRCSRPSARTPPASISDDAAAWKSSARPFPAPGSCGGMYTANTMASAIEALGMSLPNSSAQEAVSRDKRTDCRARGRGRGQPDQARHQARRHPDARGVRERHHRDDRARRLDQRRAAPAGDRARGRRASSSSTTSRASAAKVPVLADLRPSGKYSMSELIAHRRHPAADEDAARRRPAARRLPDGHRQDRCARTSRGVKPYPSGQDIVRPLDEPDQEGQPPRRPLRQPRAGRRGGEDQRQGRPAVHGQGARVRGRGGDAAGDPRRHGAARAT